MDYQWENQLFAAECLYMAERAHEADRPGWLRLAERWLRASNDNASHASRPERPGLEPAQLIECQLRKNCSE
jgi:hypothetical protein